MSILNRTVSNLELGPASVPSRVPAGLRIRPAMAWLYEQVKVRVAALHERRLKQKCLAADDVHFLPGSRVWNFQRRREAIRVGDGSYICGQLVVLAHGGEISMGHNSYIGEGSRVWSADHIEIGDRVQISHGVNIHDNNAHSLSASERYEHFQHIVHQGHPTQLENVGAAPVRIGDDVWIGFHATVLKGVTIGRGAVVGACSVVTKDVAPYSIVAGSPAHVIGTARP